MFYLYETIQTSEKDLIDQRYLIIDYGCHYVEELEMFNHYIIKFIGFILIYYSIILGHVTM